MIFPHPTDFWVLQCHLQCDTSTRMCTEVMRLPHWAESLRMTVWFSMFPFSLRLWEQCTVNVGCCLLARMKKTLTTEMETYMNCIFYNFDVTWARNKPLLFQVSDLGVIYFQSITYQQLTTKHLKTISPYDFTHTNWHSLPQSSY